jgi:toxin ParE1/3/4
MRLVYSTRAIRDLENIATYYRLASDPKVAAALTERIEQVIDRVARQPRTAPRVAGRRDVRVVLVLPYPYKVFYRERGDVVEILHIRHMARRPWVTR